MAKIIDQLSVFLPIYNEMENVEKVVLNTQKVLQDVASEWELILVNDGSTDGTKQILEKLSLSEKRIKILNHEFNEGYGASLSMGLYASKYPWIAFIDSDGQFDFNEVTGFIKKQKETGADLVIGYYKRRRVSTFKIVTSKVWEMAVFILFGLKVHDIDCGFKLVSKKVVERIPHLESKRGAFVSSELLVKAKKSGFKIVEIPITHYPRTRGVGTEEILMLLYKVFLTLFAFG